MDFDHFLLASAIILIDLAIAVETLIYGIQFFVYKIAYPPIFEPLLFLLVLGFIIPRKTALSLAKSSEK